MQQILHRLTILFPQQANPSIGLDGLFHFLSTPPTKIAFLGPAYSSVTYPVVVGSTIQAVIQVNIPFSFVTLSKVCVTYYNITYDL